MKVHRFHRQQTNNASRLLCPAIGTLIQANPRLITEDRGMYETHRNPLNLTVWSIFQQCEKEQTLSAEQAKVTLADPKFIERLGFSTEIITKGKRDTAESLLNNGVMLQATAGEVSSIFGKTAGKYWRFHPAITSDSSSLTIYDNLEEAKESLRKLYGPEFQWIKTKPTSQAPENNQVVLKAKL